MSLKIQSKCVGPPWRRRICALRWQVGINFAQNRFKWILFNRLRWVFAGQVETWNWGRVTGFVRTKMGFSGHYLQNMCGHALWQDDQNGTEILSGCSILLTQDHWTTSFQSSYNSKEKGKFNIEITKNDQGLSIRPSILVQLRGTKILKTGRKQTVCIGGQK